MEKIKGEFAGSTYEVCIYDDEFVFDVTVPPSKGTQQIGIPLSKEKLLKAWSDEHDEHEESNHKQ